ncbi:hypothetical protein M885DRAFT_499630 [Pelagophyceae sp. CCMP2097]|nr:hypothetical protein M885DRAFT_499630 [Pelagophyceae sp. CCMP2097]
MQRFVLAAVVVAAANAGDAPRPDGAAPRRLRTPSGLVAPLRLASQKAREAHAAVVRDGDAEEGDADRACEDRLETLRGLVAEKRFDEAIDLSWALDAQSPKRRNACNADAPYAGKADVLRRMFRPLKAGNATSLAERRPSATSASKAKSCDDVRIKLHGNGTTHRLRGVSARSSQLGANVVGFVLDNEFVASRATMRCDETSNGFTCTSGDGPFSFQSLEALQRRDSEVRAKPKRAKRLDDVSTDYGLGSKKLLVLITCPTAHHADCDAGYDVVKGRSTGFDLDDFGGSVKTYLQAQYEQVNAFFLKSSYGQLQYVPTLTIAKIDYDMADCGTLKYLDVYGDRLGSSVDVMAFNYARVKNGFKVQDFDFWQIILPKCDALDWSGQAYVGLEESAINLGGQDAATIA